MGLPQPPQLASKPEFDDACFNAWDTFTKLSVITYSEIKAMIDLTGNTLEPWEVEAIMGLERLRNSPKSWTE